MCVFGGHPCSPFLKMGGPPRFFPRKYPPNKPLVKKVQILAPKGPHPLWGLSNPKFQWKRGKKLTPKGVKGGKKGEIWPHNPKRGNILVKGPLGPGRC